MCATCVAQGVTYVGGALAGLQVMGARAKAKRARSTEISTPAESPASPTEGTTVADAEPATELASR